MRNVSVKLSDETKARLDRLAAEKGVTPHAFMVGAIESEIERAEKYGAFLADAYASRDEMLASGKAYAGEEVVEYLRARARGEKPDQPKLKALKSLLKKSK